MKIEVNNFDLEGTILSGSCFRVIKEEDGSFTNILKDRVINIKQTNNILTIKSNNEKDLKDVVYEYFDLNRDYNKINDYLIKNDSKMIEIINKSKGYKILNQDFFEMCISYIISQNNNVTRISNSINEISRKYGSKVIYNNKEYYLFPTYEQLKNITIDELKELKIGFRDKYIRDFLEKYDSLKDINILSTNEAIDKLMNIKGIGLKVASCILLFGNKRLDVFPIDTWVKKNVMELYGICDNVKIIKEFAKEKYGMYSAVAIQYLFNAKRNIK